MLFESEAKKRGRFDVDRGGRGAGIGLNKCSRHFGGVLGAALGMW
jgi:hypothetical protein